jgi:NMD protein affecting ribosome stability and mRNA decay
MQKSHDYRKEKPSSYYEGILQLRNPSQEVMDFVKNTLKGRKDCKVAKEEFFENGVDVYLTNQHYLRSLAKKLKENFLGHLNITATLHTQSKMGDDLYRITALFEMYPIKKGDVLNIGDEQYKIETMGQKIMLKEVKSGKKIHKTFKEIERYVGRS